MKNSVRTISLLSILLMGCTSKGEKRISDNIKSEDVNETKTNTMNNENEIITLGGGCFWCIEAVFRELKGVILAESGYSGGKVKNPSYREVCTGNTGHAEVVQVTYNPKEVSLEEVLEVFFTVHDPTTLNRQGHDVGTQYRSAIFYRNDDQKKRSEAIITELNKSGSWPNKIVTEVTPFDAFYKAEDYHQDYFNNNGGEPYCQMVIQPKLEKFRKVFDAKRIKK